MGNLTKNDAGYWVELRGDVLTFLASNGGNGDSPKAIKPQQLAFCTKVAPPPPAACTTPELKAIAEKLLVKDYIAVYMADANVFWLACEAEPRDLPRWLQVRRSLPRRQQDGPTLPAWCRSCSVPVPFSHLRRAQPQSAVPERRCNATVRRGTGAQERGREARWQHGLGISAGCVRSARAANVASTVDASGEFPRPP
jgi:hypothetical protein